MKKKIKIESMNQMEAQTKPTGETKKVSFWEGPQSAIIAVLWFIISGFLLIVAIIYAADPSINRCVTTSPTYQCTITAIETVFDPPFESIQINFALLDQNGEGGFSRINTTNLNVFSEYLTSYTLNSTYPCYLQNAHYGFFIFRNCNPAFFTVSAVDILLWIMLVSFVIFRIYKCVHHRFLSRKFSSLVE